MPFHFNKPSANTFMLNLYSSPMINGLYCNSHREALMNTLPVMMTPIDEKEFNTKKP